MRISKHEQQVSDFDVISEKLMGFSFLGFDNVFL